MGSIELCDVARSYVLINSFALLLVFVLDFSLIIVNTITASNFLDDTLQNMFAFVQFEVLSLWII